MDLKEFVATTLVQIIEGVAEAQKNVPGKRINPALASKSEIEKLGLVAGNDFSGIQTIRFDVALTTTEGTTTQGKAGVFVAPIVLGTQGQSNAATSSVSRIQFGVPISLPRGQ